MFSHTLKEKSTYRGMEGHKLKKEKAGHPHFLFFVGKGSQRKR